MRLLVCTQAVDRNDPILGFFHAWLERFAKECESVTVICLRKGEYTLPKNVEVISLGERHRILRAFELCSVAWGRRAAYDAVFVHMNPEYIVAAGWLWRMVGKQVGLWYVHKSLTTTLRIATAFSNVIFTVSNETFPISSSKVRVTGHGVDTELFGGISAVDNFSPSKRVVTVGRISAKKNSRAIIEAVVEFARGKDGITLDVYGDAVTKEEKVYLSELKAWLPSFDTDGIVTLNGALTHDKVPEALRGASVLVNMGETGGIDKAVLEAMSMGIPVISTSSVHKPLLKRYPQLIADDTNGVVEALEYVASLPHTVRIAMGGDLREEVVENHSLVPLIKKIVWTLSQNK